jgi:hypothetical protein
VRRVPPPALSTLIRLIAAAAVIGAVVALFGVRHDLPQRLASGVDLPQIILAGIAGVAAGFAAFQQALPDREPRWGWLPVPPAFGWVGTMGWGCVQESLAVGPAAFTPGVSVPCLVSSSHSACRSRSAAASWPATPRGSARRRWRGWSGCRRRASRASA